VFNVYILTSHLQREKKRNKQQHIKILIALLLITATLLKMTLFLMKNC
jgi:hypothetical protein